MCGVVDISFPKVIRANQIKAALTKSSHKLPTSEGRAACDHFEQFEALRKWLGLVCPFELLLIIYQRGE